MPRYIINARKVKHTFTGDLNKQVNPTPNVFGTEREYVFSYKAIVKSSDSKNISCH